MGFAHHTLEIQRAWKRDAIPGPSATVRQEVLGLGRTRGRIRVRKVVPPADESCACGSIILGRECWILVVCMNRQSNEATAVRMGGADRCPPWP
jgi:hypothetical protein